MLSSQICMLLVIFKINSVMSVAEEPMCSKFSCEEQLLEKMIRQEIKVEMMQNDIKKTQETVSSSLKEITKTSALVSQAIEGLRNDFNAVEKNILEKEEALQKSYKDLRQELRMDIDKHRRKLIELQENKKPSVAFFANNVVDLKLDKTNKIIVFNTATTNEGSGYDTSTGIFTAPVGGLYQFIVNYCSLNKQLSPLALVLSGNVIARSNNYDAFSHTCSSFSAVIRVKPADKIWVKCLTGASAYSLHRDIWRMNSFSGFLINK